MQKVSSLSAFFPCFNEEKNLPLFVAEALKVLPQCAKKFEIIIINDGSTDRTGEIAQRLARKNQLLRVMHHHENLGYGAALRSGFQAAQFEWIFFTDGDLQFRLSQLTKFISHTRHFNVIIGFRTNRAEGKIRALNARLFKWYIDLLFRLRVKDIDCAFKLIRRSAISQLQLESTGAFTSAELLYKLKKHHERFFQVPVTHRKRRYGLPTGNNPKVVIKAGLEALSLYLKIKIGSLAS